MNKCVMSGRLTKDPDVRYKDDNAEKAIGKFSIAVDRRFPKDTTDFFNCVAFGKLGTFVEKYLKKGTKILVTGRIENDSYTNKEGREVKTTQIVCEEIEFAESKRKEDAPEEAPQPAPDDFVSVPEDIPDLPFK